MIVKVCVITTAGRRQRLDRCLNAIRDNANFPHMIILYEDHNLNGCIEPTRLILSQLRPKDLVVVLNDDMVGEKDWLKNLTEAYLETFPDLSGLAQAEDTLHHGNLASCPMSTPEFLLEHWRPEYNHLFGDTELTYRAKHIGKYLYVPSSIIVHEHLTENEDANYIHANKFYSKDRATYLSRQSNRFFI